MLFIYAENLKISQIKQLTNGVQTQSIQHNAGIRSRNCEVCLLPQSVGFCGTLFGGIFDINTFEIIIPGKQLLQLNSLTI